MTVLVYVGAAFAEIAGCFAFWAWLRLGKSPIWLLPGLAPLTLFAALLTRSDKAAAGRVYAGTAASITPPRCFGFGWPKGHPDRWDVIGAAVCLASATTILAGQRG